MGDELVKRERKLREQVAKLTVVIDRTKLAESVDEITESEHFQRIKAQADELDKLSRDINQLFSEEGYTEK